jgi:hypothetical protein
VSYLWREGCEIHPGIGKPKRVSRLTIRWCGPGMRGEMEMKLQDKDDENS